MEIRNVTYVTCNIFYLINGSRGTSGIFDWHMLKKGILQYQTTWKNRNLFTKFLKFGPGIGLFGAEKNLFWELQLNQIIFLSNFSTAILKNNIKSKKIVPGIFVSNFRSWENNFFMFLCHAKNAVTLYLNSLSERATFMEVQSTFLSNDYVSLHVQRFKGFG